MRFNFVILHDFKICLTKCLLISVKADKVQDLDVFPLVDRSVCGSFERPDLTKHLDLEYTLYVTSRNPSLDNQVSSTS